MDLSINYSVILVGLTCKSSILFIKSKGTKLILALKSSKALSTDKTPMVTRIVKLPGSLDFKGKDF